ncbi:MAG: hypothetical protein C0518_08075 [Opitutus sp.]|nr:hypothetical protein [Opitutus sp.]
MEEPLAGDQNPRRRIRVRTSLSPASRLLPSLGGHAPRFRRSGATHGPELFRVFRGFRGHLLRLMNSLEGRWQPLFAELDGEQAPVEVLQQTELELTAATYTVRFGGVAADTGDFATEDAPHHLSLHGTAGPNAGRTIPCLFKFIEDTLMICYGLSGARPKNFRTAPGANLYLVTYRRK